MPFPSPAPRTLRHRRAITAEAYAREDGLWDIDLTLSDHKTRDFPLATGVRASGHPIHDLGIRVTIDIRMTIVDVSTYSDWVPYPGMCNTIDAAYRSLIGLNLLKGFRQAVKARLEGVLGCTHLTELTNILPTAAIQAFAGDVISTQDGGAHPEDQESTTPPFQLNRCHALRTDGPAVKEYYPRWYGSPVKPITLPKTTQELVGNVKIPSDDSE